MSGEVITVNIEPPEVVAIARTLEVACGDSYVTIKQLDGRRGIKWTVYSNDGQGMSMPVQEAPTGPTSEDVLPWASEYVRRKERESLAYADLRRKLGDAIPATDPS